MKSQKYVGVDLGGESGRIMVGEFNGTTMHLSEQHRFATGGTELNGTLRWDVNRFWSEIKHGLSRIASSGTAELVSVGVDTWGVDYVLLGSDGQLLEWPWHYRDERTRGLLAETTNRIPREHLFQQTGIQFLEFNSLYQLISARKLGATLDQAKQMMMIPDYFHYCLSGQTQTEFTNATTTQCLNPSTRDWAHPLLKSFEIPVDILPEIVEPGSKVGTLCKSVRNETGLSPINVVAPATHDTGSAVAAVPVDQAYGQDWAYISSGTWSLIGVETNTPILSEKAMKLNVTNEGGVDGTWRLLKNVMGLWLVQRLRISLESTSTELSYGDLTRQAEASPAFTSLIDPDCPQFLNPPNMLESITHFCRTTSQPIPSSAGQAVRCVLESLALKYATVLKSLEELTGRNVRVMHIVGGGSQNALLNQFVANACQVPVVAGPSEATAYGNLLVQCRSAGSLNSLADIREVVRRSSTLEYFEPKHTSVWIEAQDRFETLTRQLV
ncbi:rhamnulokinase [Bremerella sp. P1]|uniref:rhamnulokinase n=1 Tax=Bremerella sp. P1 TaxID=3026424 RepID=UPI00236808A3|nr:rhamnulokinase family protein [Bremerella sp. P1]WDI41036.1 rhamnulokinase [Bremerella sp. P1]